MSEHSLSALLPPLRLLLLGYGHVAQALLPLLASRSEWLGNELGIRPFISGIGTRSRMQSGLHVITANKGPVAFAQSELQMLARHHNVQFRFEATVMDGLPLINLAQFTLQAVGIRSFRALLNTTSSLVLSMIEQGYTLEEAIAKAQELGIAEADPWYDLDGWDAVMKTTILANTLLEGSLTPQMVEREGIRDLTLDAICASAQAGTPMRLVSSAHRKYGQLVAEVRPRQLDQGDMLLVGKGTTSVISLETEA